MAKRRVLTEKNVLQLLDKSEDEHRETDNSTLDANTDGKIDCISKIKDHILNEYPR